MRRRILFVDDEALVLEGLQRMLRPMRGEWDMSFVASGAEALELMARTPVDVVVSDMRMPRMNGAELLAEVLRRFPKAIRLILSGHADQGLILKCVGSAHQYLSKPCEPEALKAAVTRALELEASLRSQELRALVSRLERLPSVPSLYVRIVELVSDPDTSLDEVGALVGQDLAMTAKILKLVNSAFFGLGRQICSPAEAASYLGLETIKALVLSLHAFSQFEHSNLGQFSAEQLWEHSQQTAALAKEIARMENAGAKMMDEAFVAGLLHDTGQLVLASNFPGQYEVALGLVQKEGRSWLQAEEASFGANHAEVGGYLLGLWGLPTPVVEAIALHHCPSRSSQEAFSPLTAVHIADALVWQQRQEPQKKPEVDLAYLERLRIAEHLPSWRAAQGLTPQSA